jgi:preprotein translocase subunit YajC
MTRLRIMGRAISLAVCTLILFAGAAQIVKAQPDANQASASSAEPPGQKVVSEPMSGQGQGAAGAAAEPNETAARPRPAQPFGGFQIILIVVMLVFVFMMFRGPRKKQQEHRKMIQSLQKNDRVRTIGGIYGTVVDVREDEIVLKVDESTNTKIRVTPSAIGTKLADEKS